MRQVDNINLIVYLEKVLKEIQCYGIDVTYYNEKIQSVVSNYETSKKQVNNHDIYLSLNSDFELDLGQKLMEIEAELYDYILFLDLIHKTNDLKFDIEIDDLFYKVSSRFDSFLESFSTIDIQKLILVRYHDLLFKKIWKDYQSDDFDYVNKYNDLKKYPYLVDSIERFLNSDDVQFSLDGDMVCYDLKTILDRVYRFLNPIQEIVEVEDNSHSLANYDNSFVPFWRRMLIGIRNYVMVYFGSEKVLENSDKMENRINMNSKFMIDLMNRCDRLDKKHIVQRMYPGVDISWLGDAFYEIIKRVGIDKVRNKDLTSVDLTGINLSSVDFTDVFIAGANLSYTNANIDPQKIRTRNLKNCNLEGLDLLKANFMNVSLSRCNLKGTKARIDPQDYISGTCYLKNAILEGCYVINNFDGYKKENMPNLEGAILADSSDEIEEFEKQMDKYGCDVRWLGNAADEVIEIVGIGKVVYRDLSSINLTGINLSSVNFTDVWIGGANLSYTGARIDPQKVFCKDLEGCNLEGIDLSGVDFTGVFFRGANLSYTNANINFRKIRTNNLMGCNLEGLDLSKADLRDLYLKNANLRNTRARINPQDYTRKLHLANTVLEGCYVINNFDGYEDRFMPNLDGAILVDSFDEIEEIERHKTNREDSVVKKRKLIYSRRSNQNY